MNYFNSIGLDEVGRWPLAWPVTVGGVFCYSSFWDNVPDWYDKVTDSKLLSPKDREYLACCLLAHPSISTALASSSAQFIDRYGIVVAIRRASMRVIGALHRQIENQLPDWDGGIILDGKTDYGLRQYSSLPLTTLVQWDRLVWQVGAASIIAKVHRDNYMIACAKAKKFSVYGFDRHKGYGTLAHRKMIQLHGLSPLHRKSFCRTLLQDM